jgi:hypothetical protein
MKPLSLILSILLICSIICGPSTYSFNFNKVEKFSHNQHTILLPDYIKDWYVNKNIPLYEPETYTTDLMQRRVSIKEPYSNQTEGKIDRKTRSVWPMQGHDAYHTCQSPHRTENNSGAEIWRDKGDWAGAIECSPVIDSNNIIYYGTMGSELISIYPNGTRRWHFQANGIIWGTPAVAENADIYCTTWGGLGYLQAITTNGTERWRFYQESSSSSSPTIGEDGTIYFGTDGRIIFAVNPNGTQKWRYTTGDIVMGSPAIGEDGTIYVGSCDHYFYALNPNGTLRWRFGPVGEIKGSASIASDGTIYVPSFGGYFYALYPNGTMKWQASTGGIIASAGVALAQDGTIYVGTEVLRAYYPNGTLKWSTDVQGNVYGTVPAVSADGTIYVSAGGSLVAVNPDGSEKWRKTLSNEQIRSSPIIGENDRIYVGSTYSDYGYLHAFGLGPLRADAGGPYSGLASDTPVDFHGFCFGGSPPYTCHWDFGDGNTSDELEPSHLYRDIGTYHVTFTITDNDGNNSTDTTTATISYGPPTIWYIKPIHALYIANIKILPLLGPRYYAIVIGRITVQADASHPLLEIDRIEFYVDSVLQSTDRTPPYTWTWDTRYFRIRTHTLGIKAYTTNGTEAVFGTSIYKFL